MTRKTIEREILGIKGNREGHDGKSELGQRTEPSSRSGRSWFAFPNRGRDPGARDAAPSRMRGARLEDFDGCERSRMDDDFRPPSPAPFAAVTEAAPLRERDRVLGRQNFGRELARAR